MRQKTLQIFKVPPQVLIFYYIKIHKYQGTFSQDKNEDENIFKHSFCPINEKITKNGSCNYQYFRIINMHNLAKN